MSHFGTLILCYMKRIGVGVICLNPRVFVVCSSNVYGLWPHGYWVHWEAFYLEEGDFDETT